MDFQPGRCLRVYCSESYRWEGTPLAEALLAAAREQGIAGATVTKAVAGFGLHHRLHSAKLLELSHDLPLIVEIVDTPEEVDRFLRVNGRLLKLAVVTLDDVKWACPPLRD